MTFLSVIEQILEDIGWQAFNGWLEVGYGKLDDEEVSHSVLIIVLMKEAEIYRNGRSTIDDLYQ